jgi:hypothetical protein
MKTFVIRNADIRDRVIAFVQSLPLECDWKVRVEEHVEPKTRDQEKKYHAMLQDISPYFSFMGRTDWSFDDIKRLLIDAFARARQAEGKPLHQGGRTVPSLDGTGVVALGAQSRHFTDEEASDFIEYLYAFGSEAGVQWKEEPDGS